MNKVYIIWVDQTTSDNDMIHFKSLFNSKGVEVIVFRANKLEEGRQYPWIEEVWANEIKHSLDIGVESKAKLSGIGKKIKADFDKIDEIAQDLNERYNRHVTEKEMKFTLEYLNKNKMEKRLILSVLKEC